MRQVDHENGTPLCKEVYHEDHSRLLLLGPEADVIICHYDEGEVPSAPHKERKREDSQEDHQSALRAREFFFAEPFV